MERGFRFLKDPLFCAESLYLKSPRRIMALLMVMTLSLLMYSLAEMRIRSALAEKERDIWDQKNKPTGRPTSRWVSMIFEDVLLLYAKRGQGIEKKAVNLRDEHLIVLECLGPAWKSPGKRFPCLDATRIGSVETANSRKNGQLLVWRARSDWCTIVGAAVGWKRICWVQPYGGRRMYCEKTLKRYRPVFVVFVLLVLMPWPLVGEGLCLGVSPELLICVGPEREFFSLGGGGTVHGSYPFSLRERLSIDAGAELGYAFLPVTSPVAAVSYSTSTIFVGAEGSLGYRVAPFLLLRVGGGGGGYFTLVNELTTENAVYPFATAKLGLCFDVGPTLRLSVSAAYRQFFGYYGGVAVSVGTAFRLPRQAAAGIRPGAKTRPTPLEGGEELETGVNDVLLQDVYPALYTHYQDHPVGTARLYNGEKTRMENIMVKFLVRDYMSTPSLCKAPEALEAGEEAEVDLYALFGRAVLDVFEPTKAMAEISVAYSLEGEQQQREYVQTLRLEGRNSLTWDDDRKVAAFVTAKDHNVLKFARNVGGIIKSRKNAALDDNLCTAMGIHTALGLYGLAYIVDPGSAYETLSADAKAIDFVQFPGQTLEYKAGDCDDLSILYCSVLEAAGVETAFITVPGHIYMAFALKASPADARAAFNRSDDLIFEEEKVWVPVEITLTDKDFLTAWRTGAKEWREHASREQAVLFPVHDAWSVYEAAGFSVGSATIDIPDAEEIADAYSQEVRKFVLRETQQRVEELTEAIEQARDPARHRNRLAVLYSRYGLYDEAKGIYEEILGEKEYVPAMVNLGNIHFLREEMAEAKRYYGRAYELLPDNPAVVLALARVNHELENYGDTRELYERLKKLDGQMAERFSYLDLRGTEAARAADIRQVRGVVVWEEEE